MHLLDDLFIHFSIHPSIYSFHYFSFGHNFNFSSIDSHLFHSNIEHNSVSHSLIQLFFFSLPFSFLLFILCSFFCLFAHLLIHFTRILHINNLQKPYLGVEVVGEIKEEYLKILTYDALEFLADLHRRFDYTRKQVLKKRMDIQRDINAGKKLAYPLSNRDNNNDWQVANVPHDLQMRHVEITGPTDCKMVINALNSGADVFMADFEDSLSPSWKNIIEGQINLLAANRKNIAFTNPDGKISWVFSLSSLSDLTLKVHESGFRMNVKHNSYCTCAVTVTTEVLNVFVEITVVVGYNQFPTHTRTTPSRVLILGYLQGIVAFPC